MAQETKTAAGQVLYYVVMVVLSTLGVSFAAWSLHLARAKARRERSSSALAAGATDATLEARANNIEEATVLPGAALTNVINTRSLHVMWCDMHRWVEGGLYSPHHFKYAQSGLLTHSPTVNNYTLSDLADTMDAAAFRVESLA